MINKQVKFSPYLRISILQCVDTFLLYAFQKPLLLHGHDRPITQIKYNREGDLLFSASKAHVPNVWYSVNGERLGTFNGHQGAVWTIDVDWKTTRLMSGSADQYLKIWDCETGWFDVLFHILIFQASLYLLK